MNGAAFFASAAIFAAGGVFALLGATDEALRFTRNLPIALPVTPGVWTVKPAVPGGAAGPRLLQVRLGLPAL